MYNTITAKQHGMNFITVAQLAGHGIYYVQVNNSWLHISFHKVDDAISHINTYLPVKGIEY